MKVQLVAILLAVATASAAAELPAPGEFWYCYHLYQWLDGQLKPDSSLKKHAAASLDVFRAGALILSRGITNAADYKSAAERLRENLKSASERNGLSEFARNQDAQCWVLQREHSQALMTKAEEVGRA